MQANEKGFSVVEILAIIVVVGLLGAVGWLVYDRQKSKTDEPTTQSSTKQTIQDDAKQDSKENTTTTPKMDTTIHEVSISLKSEADLAKLPDYTPASFKSYLAEKLRNNKPFDNGEAIVAETWIISTISQVNIRGGQVPTDKDGNSYPGGAPIIWVLTPAGTWDQESLNGPVCTSKNGGKIYEEFVTTCYDGGQPDGVKNPNGSIKLLAQ